MDRNERLAVIFERLFLAYPQSSAGDQEALLLERMARAKVFFEAVAPYDVRDVEQAITNLLTGSAPGGHNPSFSPPPPVVASEARRCMNLRLDSEHRERMARPALPPPDIVHTPEARARVAAKAQQYINSVADHMRTEDAERDRRMRELSSRTDSRFQPDMDPYEVKRRLGFDVGDADGDRDVA